MELRHSITQQSWILDFQVLLHGAFHGGQEEIQIVRLEDHLDTRYIPDLRVRAFSSLKYSYNWVARNWVYFEEVGLVRKKPNGGVEFEHSLIFALYHIVSEIPTELLDKVPQLDPAKLIPVAQRYIDAEKNPPQPPEE